MVRRLTYETAIATFIQFILITLLGIPNALVSIIETCHSQSNNCVSNLLTSLLTFILTAAWFGLLLLFAYRAQERRSKFSALILIGGECLTLGVALGLDLRSDSNILRQFTSIADGLLALWIIWLAVHILRSKGARIVRGKTAHQRPRQRRGAESRDN